MSQNCSDTGSRRELQAADQVARQRDHVVGGHRELVEGEPLLGLERDLRSRPRDARVEAADQVVGGVAHLADVQIVELGIHLGRARHRRPAERRDLAGRVGARADVLDLRLLDVHAAHQHHVGPGEVGLGRARDVLVDEAHRPGVRHVGGDQQEPLRRHEGAHPAHQRKGMLERAERRRVGGKHAEDAALAPNGNRRTHSVPVVMPRRRSIAGYSRDEMGPLCALAGSTHRPVRAFRALRRRPPRRFRLPTEAVAHGWAGPGGRLSGSQPPAR